MRRRGRKLLRRIEEAETRAGHLATSELYEWAEQCQYLFGWCINEQRHTANDTTAANMLDEAVLAAEVGRVIAQELQRRRGVYAGQPNDKLRSR